MARFDGASGGGGKHGNIAVGGGGGGGGGGRKHGSIQLNDDDDDAPSISSMGKKDSYDELMSTYVLPNSQTKINKRGMRDDLDHSLDLKAGTVNPEDLVVLEELGRGASAVVNRCTCRAGANGEPAGREYVVKCFNMYDEHKRSMLRKEVDLLLSMDCPSIVEFHGAYLDDQQRVCLILEMMDRGSVEDVINYARRAQRRTGAAQAIPERVLAAMAYQVVHGLRYLSNQRLMHRDIKPPNLLVNSAGQTKITDFGIGKRLGPSPKSATNAAANGQMLEGVTEEDEDEEDDGMDGMAQTFVGTRSYMSYERLMGEEFLGNADCWSLGVILMECALGRHPLSDCLGNYAGLIETLRELPVESMGDEDEDEEGGGEGGGQGLQTLGSRLEPVAAQYSEEFGMFVKFCLLLDKHARGSPWDLVVDDWFRMHLDEGGVEGAPDPEAAEDSSNDALIDARLERATVVVKAWLDGPTMAGYRGPADPSKRLSSMSLSASSFAASATASASFSSSASQPSLSSSASSNMTPPPWGAPRPLLQDMMSKTIDSDDDEVAAVPTNKPAAAATGDDFMATLQSDSDSD
jgi:serine/threonine protein kinase